MQFKNSLIKLAFKNSFLPIKKTTVVIEPHLGLGDNLICLALVREISARNPEVNFYYACLHRCYQSLAWMFQDLNNVFLFAVHSGREARQLASFFNANYLPIGIENVDIKRFDEFFYQQHNVDFNCRWSSCVVPPGPQSEDLFLKLNPQKEPYILVCRRESGLVSYELNYPNLNQKKVIEVEPLTNNIFDWSKLVLMADEIHTIDTAFVHFVESTLSGESHQKLFYHLARKSPTEFTRRLPWQVIRY